MPTLADIYSAIDSAKRKASDFVRNPGTSLEQMVNYANDRARNYNDQLYLAAQATGAPARGQQPTPEQIAADKYVTQTMAEAYNPTGMTLSYKGSHLAPGPDFGAPLHDLTGGGQMYPADVYSQSAARIYGTGNPLADKQAFALAKQVRGNPNAEVTMYRAVPKNSDITNINAGDWVTLSKDYAKGHGEHALQGDYKILSQKVKAKDLWTNADSIHEFGYHPE